MYEFLNMTKRNILIFIRDKTTVFLSFLSVFILLLLYVLFIGNGFVDGFVNEGAAIDNKLKTFLITSIVMGGAIVVNTASLSLGVMSSIVSDLESNKLDGFLVSPIKRHKIILSYYVTSIIITTVLTIFLWFLAVLYVGVASGYWYKTMTVLKVSSLIILYTFISSTFMIFMTSLIKSTNAFSTLAGVFGTIIGFISGAYIPLSQLGKLPLNIASLVPFSHMTMQLKQILLEEPYKILKTAPGMTEELFDIATEAYGTNQILIFNNSINIWLILGVSALIGITLLFITYKRLNNKMEK
ncbi:MAG: ABC transporter permease [Acholeplasmataceae bacterium]|jgi:multidrug/hemolysin transport system permease protein